MAPSFYDDHYALCSDTSLLNVIQSSKRVQPLHLTKFQLAVSPCGHSAAAGGRCPCRRPPPQRASGLEPPGKWTAWMPEGLNPESEGTPRGSLRSCTAVVFALLFLKSVGASLRKLPRLSTIRKANGQPKPPQPTGSIRLEGAFDFVVRWDIFINK